MLPLYYKQDADNRKHQINTLKIFNDNVIEVVADSEYEIPFKCGGNKLCLKISLGHDFPKGKPTLVINPVVIHPWVSESGLVTSAPGLVNFTIHSDLGRVVQAIIREFQRHPPPLVPNNNASSKNIPIIDSEKHANSTFKSNHSFSPPSNLAAYAPKKNHTILFAELNQLSFEELMFLNENNDRLMEYLDEHAPMKGVYTALDDVILQIEELAGDNLKQEGKLKLLKEAVDLKIEESNSLSQNNEKLYSIYQSLSERYSPRNIQVVLRNAALEAEEESDKIANSFLEGNLEVDAFLNAFIKTKALCQLRKTKEEKLGQQLDRLKKAGF